MKVQFALALVLFAVSALAQGTKFPYGNGLEKWGIPVTQEGSELTVRVGARFQGLATIRKEESRTTNTETTFQDFQARRVRFQLQADLGKRASFIMDVRNDNANQKDEGEKAFNVGDAYVHLPLSEGSSHAIRLYRAKVDVSRTQTISSSELLFVNRPYIADEAASFVSHQRRASNIQMIGHFNKKASYQIVAGDGVASDRFSDSKGNKLTLGDIKKQNFMVGGKVRLHPLEGWEEKMTETYFGEGKHLSFGGGIFNTSNIYLDTIAETVSRTLINAEFSAHYKNFMIQSEYFKMNGMIENLTATDLRKGVSEGYYVQSEYVLPEFHFFAPFFRYENWNRFIETGDYGSEHNLYGINWYLNGNRFRVTLAYEQNNLGKDIKGGQRVEALHLASMWHF